MKIYWVMLEAVPFRGTDDSRKYGGAYVDCWVRAETPDAALTAAKLYTVEEGWVPFRIEEIQRVNRVAYHNMPDSRALFDDACKYGCSAAFYTWPIGGE